MGKRAKILRFKYSACNDERLKLVNDMVVGIRTLKSYGWEEQYLKKITGVRQVQKKWNFIIVALQTLGYNLFQNLALIAVFLIFLYEWSQGNEIDVSKGVSTLAIIFYLFVAVNQLSFIAIFQIANFFAILQRIGSVMKLEEFKDGGDGAGSGSLYDESRALKDGLPSSRDTARSEGNQQGKGTYIKVEDASYNWGFRMTA